MNKLFFILVLFLFLLSIGCIESYKDYETKSIEEKANKINPSQARAELENGFKDGFDEIYLYENKNLETESFQ